MSIFYQVLSQFAAVLPNLVGALVILIAGVIICRIVARITERLLKAIGTDKLARYLQDIDLIRKMELEIKPSKILAKLLYYILLLIFVIAAVDVLQIEAVSALMGQIIEYIPRLLSAILLFIVGLWLADAIQSVTAATLRSMGIASGGFIAGFVFYFIILAVGISALQQAEVETQFITTALSIMIGGIMLAFALGYGLASVRQARNITAGFFLRRHYRVHDRLRIDGRTGRVTEISSADLTITYENGVRRVFAFAELRSKDIEILPSDPDGYIE